MLLSHCNSSKWHNSKQCGSKEKNPRVQIHVAIKIYSFIHSIHFRNQTSKQTKEASNYRKADGPTDRRRSTTTTDRSPTTDRRRPIDDDDRPIADDRPPTTDRRRSPTTDDDRRSTTTADDRRRPPTTDRPPTIDDARFFWDS